METFRDDCYSNAPATSHQQAQQYFKQRLRAPSAEFCFAKGWYQSSPVVVYRNTYLWDIGNWCNYNGAFTNVFIDSWQYSWNGNAWIGGAWRPATRHCHCP